MERILTAEEYLSKQDGYLELKKRFPKLDIAIKEVLIEFAQLHAEAALKSASEKALTEWASTDFYDDRKVVSKSSILKSYPLSNIK